jgi:hypothetical protein
MVRSIEEEGVYGEARSDAIQRTARRGGQSPAWWSASCQTLPHNGAPPELGGLLAHLLDDRLEDE